jgi:hypothetical protein
MAVSSLIRRPSHAVAPQHSVIVSAYGGFPELLVRWLRRLTGCTRLPSMGEPQTNYVLEQ